MPIGDEIKSVGRCYMCEFGRMISDGAWGFPACYHPPYKGKWVAEIKDCPKTAKEIGIACRKCRESGTTKVCIDNSIGYVCPHYEAAQATLKEDGK